MFWFRANLRLGAGLALVALAVQIALSLVHAHFGAFTVAPGVPKIVAQTGQGPAPLPNVPASDRRSNGLTDDCPLCALIHLAAMWLPSAPPGLELPDFAGSVGFKPPTQFALVPFSHRSFWARAPPLA